MPDMILGTREVKIRTQILNTTINLSNYSLQKRWHCVQHHEKYHTALMEINGYLYFTLLLFFLQEQLSHARQTKRDLTRAATNDYFDNQLVGRLLFRLIR